MTGNTQWMSAAALAAKVGMHSIHLTSELLRDLLNVHRKVNVHWERSPGIADVSIAFPNLVLTPIVTILGSVCKSLPEIKLGSSFGVNERRNLYKFA